MVIFGGVSVFGCKSAAAEMFCLYRCGSDIRICNDYVWDYHRRDDKKKCYWRFQLFGNSKILKVGELYINAIVPVLIVPYYSIIGDLGRKVSCRVYKGQCGQTFEADGYLAVSLRRYKGGFLLVCDICSCSFCVILGGVEQGVKGIKDNDASSYLR